MKLYKKILIITMLTVTMLGLNNKTFYGNENTDMFKEILSSVDTSVEKYAVEGSFYSDEKQEKIYTDIIKSIENIMGQVKLIGEEKNSFKISFNNKEYDGKISIVSYKQGYEVVLNISIDGFHLDIDEENQLSNKISEILSPISSVTEYSLCVKSKILSNTIEEVKDTVLDQFKLHESQNIDEVEISNGYSIISNTNMYDEKIILGKAIDFNCAIVKYSSGCYLIMGTPEITVTY